MNGQKSLLIYSKIPVAVIARMKLSIVIPCLNELATIEKAVRAAKDAGKKYLRKNFEVIVADNGSTDGTLEKLAKLKDTRVLNVPIRGYGAALHCGILSAKAPHILFADADLSYDFNELHKFLPFINNGYDLVLGSRLRGKISKGAMPYLNRYLGTPVLTFLINILYKIESSDCNSGMRLVRKSFYKKLKMKNSGMEWASELLIKSALNKARYAEVPIIFRKDRREKAPNLKRWQDGWRHLKVILLAKPSIFVICAVILAVIGIIFIPFSLFTTIAFFLIAEFFMFSYLAAQMLESAIQKESNIVSTFIAKTPTVKIAIVITFLGFLQLLFVSDSHIFTKYILLFQAVLFDLWLFFVETINTHIVNRLPD